MINLITKKTVALSISLINEILIMNVKSVTREREREREMGKKTSTRVQRNDISEQEQPLVRERIKICKTY